MIDPRRSGNFAFDRGNDRFEQIEPPVNVANRIITCAVRHRRKHRRRSRTEKLAQFRQHNAFGDPVERPSDKLRGRQSLPLSLKKPRDNLANGRAQPTLWATLALDGKRCHFVGKQCGG
jgi:hypothetical protein